MGDLNETVAKKEIYFKSILSSASAIENVCNKQSGRNGRFAVSERRCDLSLRGIDE